MKITEGSRAYQEKLKDPRWREFKDGWIKRHRQRIQSEDPATCWTCEQENGLQLHHRRYELYREPWEYEDDDFFLLCPECHSHVHKVERAVRDWIISQCPSLSWEFEYFLNELKESPNPRVSLARAKNVVRQLNYDHEKVH